MRFFFIGPRIFGIRPGISLRPSDFRRALAPASPGRSTMTGSFVYVIEGESGHHKIGVSRDPIQRLAQLQTGSHVPLRFAYIGVTPGTGYEIEGRAHELLDAHRKAGEWFLVPASIATGATLEAAARLGEPIQQVQPEMVPQIIYQASRPDRPAGASIRWSWALALFVVIFALVFSLVRAAVAGPLPTGVISDRAVSCPKDEDYDRYLALLNDDVSAAIAFYHDHGCVMLQPPTVVMIEHGSAQNPSNHICVRPVGSYDCLWTFAGHVKAD